MNDFQTSPEPDDAAPDGAADPPPARPLLRRDEHKHLAGVAGGIADYVGVDAVVIRMAFAVLTIFGGIGIPLYLVGWAAMPSPSMPRSYVDRWFADTPNPATVIAIAIGFIILLAAVSEGPGGTSAGWGLVLLFGGWLLFRSDSRSTATVYGPAAGTGPDTAGAETGGWRGQGGASFTDSTPGAAAAPTAAWSAPPRRPPSILGRLTIGGALAAVGVAAALHQLAVVDLEPAQFVALAMTIVGIGLIVGAWIGHAYGLIGVGFLLLPVLLVSSLGPLPLSAGIGEASYEPASLTTLPDSYSLGIGELEIDLTDVAFEGTATELDVSVGIGQTTITVPADVTVFVQADMRAGVVDLFDRRSVGRPFLASVTETDEGQQEGGQLRLQIDNGVGELIVRRQGEEL